MRRTAALCSRCARALYVSSTTTPLSCRHHRSRFVHHSIESWSSPPPCLHLCESRDAALATYIPLAQELFPQFAGMVKDEAYERLALQEVSRLPAFSYTGPVLHLGKSAVLLGERYSLLLLPSLAACRHVLL